MTEETDDIQMAMAELGDKVRGLSVLHRGYMIQVYPGNDGWLAECAAPSVEVNRG